MRTRAFLLLCALLALIPSLGRAQDFGVMESAETINQGNFSLNSFLISLVGAIILLGIVNLFRRGTVR